MGASLVVAAFALYRRKLSGNAFSVLAHMAVTIPDRASRPEYWAGREMLAYALGVNDDTAGRRKVKRAVVELVESGAITRANVPGNGRRAVYRLTFAGAGAVAPEEGPEGSYSGVGGQERSKLGDRNGRVGGQKLSSWVPPSDPPRRRGEEEQREEQQSPSRVRHLPPVPDDPSPRPTDPPTLDQLITRAREEGRL